MTGEELKLLRTKSKMTQSELADYMGYYSNGKPNRSVISRWENGITLMNPRIGMLLRLYFMQKEKSND